MRSFRFRPSQFARSLAEEPKHSAARKNLLHQGYVFVYWKIDNELDRSHGHSGKVLFVEYEILGFEIWNTAQGIRNPAQGRIQDFV